jgi:hypothetical protein
MKTIVTLFLFATLVFAQNPSPYSAIGDIIYNNVDAIETLKDIETFSNKSNKIDEYISDVHKTKKLGYLLESKDTEVDKLSYLKKLRELKKRYDYLIRDVVINFKGSMKSQDSSLFSKLINSGLLDVLKYKKEILKYYSTHSDEIDKDGAVQYLLDHDLNLKNKKAESNLTYQEIQAARIKRIKEKDRKEKEKIKKRLEKEAAKKKLEIRKNQRKELAKP